MPKKQKLYFAHPVNTYDTKTEKKCLDLVARTFPQYIIENPNQPHHQIGYAEWKKRLENDPQKSGGMSYFFEKVLPDCEAGTVALPFLDGLIGAGVASEIVFSLIRSRGCFLIDIPNLKEIRPVNIREIRLLIQWSELKKNTPSKTIAEITGNILVLSIKETRKRTWLELYKKMRPYKKAHLIR